MPPHLADNLKPNAALIKLVEACGTVLGIPKTFSKSRYKAPAPSCYDATLNRLMSDFEGTVHTLSTLQNKDISNEVAKELYKKTCEPGFSYEDAVNSGGLMARDLFNALVIILANLSAEKHRVPIKKTNVLLLVDGSRPSYLAMDLATHLHSHGACHVVCIQPPEDVKNQTVALIETHLYGDISRRCSKQYKIPKDALKIHCLSPNNSSEVDEFVLSLCGPPPSSGVDRGGDSGGDWVLVVGVDPLMHQDSVLHNAALWLAWSTAYDVVTVKSCSRPRPFHTTACRRKVQICLKTVADLDHLFAKSLCLIKPGDLILFACVVEDNLPRGDSTVDFTRFGMGARCGWVAKNSNNNSSSSDVPAPTSVGWNDKLVEELNRRIQEVTRTSGLGSDKHGVARVCVHSPKKTVGEELCAIAAAESVDVMMMLRGKDREVSAECLEKATCSVVFFS